MATVIAEESTDSSPSDDAPARQPDALVEGINDPTPPGRVEAELSVEIPAVGLTAPTSVPNPRACERGSHSWTLRAKGRDFVGVVDDQMGRPEFEWVCPRCGITRCWEDSSTPATDRAEAWTEVPEAVEGAPDPQHVSQGQTSFGSEAAMPPSTSHGPTSDQAEGLFAPPRNKATEEPDRIECPICDEETLEPLKGYRGHQICEACYDALTGAGRRPRS